MIAATSGLTQIYYGVPLWVWICAGLAVIALIILIAVISHSGRKRDRWDRAFSLRLADGRWVADSLTLAVADRTKNGDDLTRIWNDGAIRIATLSQQLYELAAVAPSNKRAGQARQLATAVDNLRAALDGDVRLRFSGYGPGQDALIAESAMVISQWRQSLNNLLASLGA